MKLIITDKGDESVGIYPVSWEVECPQRFDENDTAELEFFRSGIVDIYEGYCEGRCVAEYDFEGKYKDIDINEPVDKKFELDNRYKCTFCKENFVNSDEGFDTCDECLRKQ